MVVFVATAAAYFALHGELPYHDAQRFTNQVSSDQFVWDIAHLLLQPTALLLYRWSGADPVTVLKALSSLSAAAAVGLFCFLLQQMGVRRWHAILGTLLLAGSCSVLTLAPSAHPKLAAFPFVNGALLCLCVAERRGGRNTSLLLMGGVLIAFGAAFLASVLATAPFVALAVLFGAKREGASWDAALWRAAFISAACGVTFVVLVCGGYVVFTGEPLTIAGLTGSVIDKAGLRPASLSPPVYLARIVFGTANNLVSVPSLGTTIQAWMRGQISSFQLYAPLLPILLIWLSSATLVAVIYLKTAIAVLRGRAWLTPIAFLCGAQTWTVYYGLNDPEHWFQLTAPTILLFLTLMSAMTIRIVLPVWAAVATVANLVLLALPVAAYPLSRDEVELSRMFGPKDLLVLFAAYPGRPYAGFYDMPDVRTLALDLRLRDSGTVDRALQGVDSELSKTLREGGRVVVADILDPLDWEAPWMALLSQGITKTLIERTLLASRTATPLKDVGEIKLWELRQANLPP